MGLNFIVRCSGRGGDSLLLELKELQPSAVLDGIKYMQACISLLQCALRHLNWRPSQRTRPARREVSQVAEAEYNKDLERDNFSDLKTHTIASYAPEGAQNGVLASQALSSTLWLVSVGAGGSIP